MNYKSRMLSQKRNAVAAALMGLSLVLLPGCKSGDPYPEPTAVTTPPVVETKKPAPPLTPTPLPANPTAPSNSSDSMAPNILTWDSVSREYFAQPGEKIAPFSFSFTNVSPRQVVIYDTETSCDCTVATLPSRPWTIPSGGTGTIGATINLSNKVGTVTNYVIIETSQGNRLLSVKAIVPDAR
jgi:hypothetical protein